MGCWAALPDISCFAAGAVAEAGAQQAGDMMQDFKTAHLLGVSPRAQFFAMLLGSTASVFVSVGAYKLYTTAWEVPGPELPAPTAAIWLDMASLVSGCPDIHAAAACPVCKSTHAGSSVQIFRLQCKLPGLQIRTSSMLSWAVSD